MFRYVNKFLKLKQQADGWPRTAQTEAQKQKYLEDYEEREQIQLDPELIQKNPGLRCLSKLCLNSFWGKVSTRDLCNSDLNIDFLVRTKDQSQEERDDQ